MSWVFLLLVVICSLTIIVDVLLIFVFVFRFKASTISVLSTPTVSVLVAARNEEKNIRACIESLLQLDYPLAKLELLIGDDQSSDNTREIILEYAQKYQYIKLVDIRANMGSVRGKANVLAHLAKEASGEVLLITDADVEVPESWVEGMLKGLANQQVGIVNGFTKVKNNIWQNVDWIFALGMMKALHDIRMPVTAMGNNMLITRKAYEAVGGYESIPFSITEDFELFKHVSSKGYKTIQLLNEDIVAKTQPQPSLKKLLQQRKRWMTGAVQLPAGIVVVLILQALYYPAILGLVYYSVEFSSIVFVVKMLMQAIFILLVATKLQSKLSFTRVLLFECYSAFIAFVSGIFYLLPVKISWKGRKY